MTVAEWWQLLADACYSLPSLPENAYGRAYSRFEEMEVRQGLADVGTLGPPASIATMMAAPTIAEHGTAEQIERYIPPILRGQETWNEKAYIQAGGNKADLANPANNWKGIRDGIGFDSQIRF